MVLRYMVSGTELATGSVLESDEEAPVAKGHVARRQRGKSQRRLGVRFWFVVVAVVACLIAAGDVYRRFRSNGTASMPGFLARKGQVTAIMYNPEDPHAMIDGQVVQEGETVNGYRVVKIHADKVELERKGKIVTRQVHK